MDERLKQEIVQQLGPETVKRLVSEALSRIDPESVQPDAVRPLIAALEQTLQDPSTYTQTARALIEAGVADPGDMPEQFDPTFVILMLITLTELVKLLSQKEAPAFKRGGLATVAQRLRSKGRDGDSVLAHINPMEAAALRKMGGRESVNPATGLPEYGLLSGIADAVKGLFKSVSNAVSSVTKDLGPAAPIIASVIAPYAIPSIASSLGVGSLAAGALYGAGSAALTGGNPLQGAVLGGMSGGLGDTVGGYANQLAGGSLSPAVQGVLGSALVGGTLGAATGQGFGKGALGAATGTMLGNAVGNLAGNGYNTPLGQGLTAAGKTIGGLSTAGMPLKQALVGGLLSGAFAGYNAKPAPGGLSQLSTKDQISRIDNLISDPTTPQSVKDSYLDYRQQLVGGQGLQDTGRASLGLQVNGQTPPAGMGATNVGFNGATGMVAAAALSPILLEGLSRAQTPQQVQGAVQNSNPEYFNNLRLQNWNWEDLQNKAHQSGQDLGTYVATHWGDLTSNSRYTSPGGAAPQVKMARGGALSSLAYLARGAGTGRSDEIDARLSDGEYVMDAETVALLGDGSTKAGAKKLDLMRSQLREHKGKQLAKGKISPDAKSPLAYLKGAA